MIKHDLISILDLSFEEIESIFSVASLGNEIFTEYKNALEDKVLGSLFFQPSTRTQFSLQSAFIRLGGNYIGCNNIDQTRSGSPYYESVDELGAMVSNYCDLIIMRTIDALQTDLIVQGATIPVISAGSGNVEHPTQALTDLFTLQKVIGSLTNNKILIVGTPRQRTINSFIKGISQWTGNEFYIICQQGITIDNTIIDSSINSHVHYFDSWESIFESGISKDISVIYIDKIFYETHKHNRFVIEEDEFKHHFNKSVTILHPLPRTTELSKYMDMLPGAQYFNQAKYGLYVRASLYLHYLDYRF